jgi:amino acid adenylation domain-containing protein
MTRAAFSMESSVVQSRPSPHLPQVPRSSTFVEFGKEDIEQSIPARFEKIVEQYPERIAIKTKEAGLTYDQLNQQANRVAHALLCKGQPIAEPVAFLLEDGIPPIVILLGILKAGYMYLPLDPTLPANRLVTIIEDSQTHLIVTDQKNAALAQEVACGNVAVCTLEDWTAQGPTTNPGLTVSPDSLATIFYTSGSAGQPKGVITNHRVMLHTIMNLTNHYGISRDDRVALLFLIAFAASVGPLFGPLLNGATLLPYNLKADGFSGLASWLRQEQITFYMSVPSTFRRLVATLPDTAPLSHLRLIVLGGEPVYKRDVELYLKHFSDGCLLCVHFAGTEARTISCYVIDKATPIKTNLVPVGYAAADKKILLLDDQGQEVPVNETGEIAVKSRYLAVGYWRNPHLTQSAFQSAAQGGEERIYRTGDLGRMRPDGCLEYLGRKDSQVKIRGHRVETGEVEMTLLDLEAVKEAAVTVKEDSTGRKYLAAYCVPRSAPLPSTNVLRAALANTLPVYMLPSRFIPLESLPLTATGKVDYRALPDPPRTRPHLSHALLAPGTAEETALQRIWQEILDIQPIGVQDDFFDLGGDSLAAVDVLTRLEQEFQVLLPPEVFIHEPTIAALAHRLGQQKDAAWSSPLIAIQPSGSKPPFFCTGGYGGNVLQFRGIRPHLDPDQPFYGLRDPRLGHKKVAFTRIADIARRHVETLLARQPHGPYYIGGYSFGCLVAFEIAQQLQRAGHDVGALLFLDLPNGCLPRRPGPTLGPKIRSLMRQPSLSTVYSRIITKLALLTKRLTPAFIAPLSVLEANVLAKIAYVPQVYPGRIIFLQTKNNQGVPLMWKPLIAGGIEVQEIPGDHYTMWQEPHVSVLAEKIKVCLTDL